MSSNESVQLSMGHFTVLTEVKNGQTVVKITNTRDGATYECGVFLAPCFFQIDPEVGGVFFVDDNTLYRFALRLPNQCIKLMPNIISGKIQGLRLSYENTKIEVLTDKGQVLVDYWPEPTRGYILDDDYPQVPVDLLLFALNTFNDGGDFHKWGVHYARKERIDAFGVPILKNEDYLVLPGSFGYAATLSFKSAFMIWKLLVARPSLESFFREEFQKQCHAQEEHSRKIMDKLMEMYGIREAVERSIANK
jgi:hypothetical protein